MDLDRMHRILPHLYLGDLKDMEMVNLCVPFMKSLEDVAAAINASTTNASADGASTTSVTASATAITSATTVATTKYNKTEVSEIIHSFKNTPMLHQLSRITHILTLLPDTSKAYAPLSHCIFEIEDSENADILTLLPQCIKFIDDAIESGGTVLVHCYAGVSRSASVVISYIMYLSKRLSILNKNRVADAAGTAGTADTANTASETNNSENSSSSTTSTTTTEFAIKSTEMHGN